jgi:hypothetical protein
MKKPFFLLAIIFLVFAVSCDSSQNVNLNEKNESNDFIPVTLTKLTGSFDGSYLVQGDDKIPYIQVEIFNGTSFNLRYYSNSLRTTSIDIGSIIQLNGKQFR